MIWIRFDNVCRTTKGPGGGVRSHASVEDRGHQVGLLESAPPPPLIHPEDIFFNFADFTSICFLIDFKLQGEDLRDVEPGCRLQSLQQAHGTQANGYRGQLRENPGLHGGGSRGGRGRECYRGNVDQVEFINIFLYIYKHFKNYL